jgi:hypothetical protein
MGDPVNVVRMTISVPRQVKEQMDAAAEKVNWSAIATKAFQAELLALESERQAKTMDEVVARLKAAAAIEANEDYQAGHEAGEAWAKEHATPKQLRRLEKLADDPQYDIESHLDIFANVLNRGIANGLYEVIEPEGEMCEAFWESVIGDNGKEKMDEEDFAKGFIEGALEVWDAVKDKL